MALRNLETGIKTDPIEYRYSYRWLFRLLAEEGIRNVQIGTFFEIYQLPDSYFDRLRAEAAAHDLAITSVFTAHRELGGFFSAEPETQTVARRNFLRLLEVGARLGATSVGSNPGATLRDQLELKPQGIACYLQHLKELMHEAHTLGVAVVGIEPMSCLAEPPTLPGEIEAMLGDLTAHHATHPGTTARPGLCADISHGYANRAGQVVHDNYALMEAALPWTTELHLKNTDAVFNSTFGFTAEECARGIVDLAEFRRFLTEHAQCLPVEGLIGYLEIGGPKLGRDYSDWKLEAQLRESLRHVRETFEGPVAAPTPDALKAPSLVVNTLQAEARQPAAARAEPAVRVAPSLMCADLLHFADAVHELETIGADWLHWDVMDAHFVPNMPLGLELIGQARGLTSLPFDVHLMVENNDFFIERLAAFKPDTISVHVETARHLDRTLDLIRASGAAAGVALNPATPLGVLEHVLERIDFVLIMTVNPGYAGQQLVPGALRKISATRQFLEERECPVPIQVDGNVSFAHIPDMVAAGADVLVAGTSSVFARGTPLIENMRRTRAAIAEGLARRVHGRAVGQGYQAVHSVEAAGKG